MTTTQPPIGGLWATEDNGRASGNVRHIIAERVLNSRVVITLALHQVPLLLVREYTCAS